MGVVSGVVSGVAGSGPVFVFPGQGSQWVGMAVELMDSSPVFREWLVACAGALESWVDWSLVGVLRGVAGAPGLERVDVVQPVLWAVMVSLAGLWGSLGVVPSVVVGHSQGEIAAACVAGALSLVDGARVVAVRSRLVGEWLSGRGGMASVGLPVAVVEEWLGSWGGRLSVAAVNGPSSTVVSGDRGALDEFLAGCESREVWVRRVAVDYASHSVQVDGVRGELLAALEGLSPRVPDIPFFSTVTGELVDSAVLDAGYWARNLREPVKFEPAVRRLVDQGHRMFIEVSSHPVLTVGVQETIDAADSDAVTIGTLRRDDGGPRRFLASVAEAFTHGVAVDWAPVFEAPVFEAQPRRVDLPTYAFQEQRYW
ncbi:acyltransferase domain-containing protein, partial [Frankia sp. AiPa1]|nr:acyltransferase domain-containing protein [Frankia sp. AiPa1]